MLDTTWRLFSGYVTSILTACLFNTSLPIAFAFGHSESTILYKFLLSNVEIQTGFDFHFKIFASDQGSSLKSLFKEYSIMHLYCLRHFLAGLKHNDYSFEIENLVKCASTFELDNCKFQFAQNFSEITQKNPVEIIKINKALKKIGLLYSNKLIKINDEKKWEKISMLRRIRYGMPSTTNSLEATHGHLNHKILRRNNFFTAFDRICTDLNMKYTKLNDRISHNFNYITSKTRKKIARIPKERINQSCAFYDTTVNECLCSENKLESSNYHTDIPCYHRLFKGAVFPEKPEISLELENQYDSLEIKDDDINETIDTLVGGINDQKNYTVRTIKDFSHYKNESDIIDFVEKNTNDEECVFFILDQKVSLIDLIEEGIYYFKEKKQ